MDQPNHRSRLDTSVDVTIVTRSTPGRARVGRPVCERPSLDGMSDVWPEGVVEVSTESAAHTREVGAALADLLRVGDLLVLSGDLGAGKTCLTQGIGVGLGIVDRITSPTFTISAEYDGRLRLFHLDVYRLDDASETLDLDLPELAEAGVTVIEWGQQIDSVLPAERLLVELHFRDDEPEPSDEEFAGDDRRTLALRWSGPSWAERSDALARLREVAAPC